MQLTITTRLESGKRIEKDYILAEELGKEFWEEINKLCVLRDIRTFSPPKAKDKPYAKKPGFQRYQPSTKVVLKQRGATALTDTERRIYQLMVKAHGIGKVFSYASVLKATESLGVARNHAAGLHKKGWLSKGA